MKSRFLPAILLLFVVTCFTAAQDSKPAEASGPRVNAITPQTVGTVETTPAAQETKSEDAKSTVPAKSDSSLRMSGGDLVDIKVYGVPELSDTVRVGANGEPSLPLIGAVQVAGLNAQHAGRINDKQLAAIRVLRDPHVTIVVE